jgi:hypothetical protein
MCLKQNVLLLGSSSHDTLHVRPLNTDSQVAWKARQTTLLAVLACEAVTRVISACRNMKSVDYNGTGL